MGRKYQRSESLEEPLHSGVNTAAKMQRRQLTERGTMSEAFDPYRKWLGIPPTEQPPNHYRLLGIAPYEDDPDVITHAADRQMTHLRTFQGGKYRDQSQQILNEVSAARVCLLSAEKKSAYDAQLKQQLAPPVSVRWEPPPPPPQESIPQGSVPRGTLPEGKAVAVGAPVSHAAPVVRTSGRSRPGGYARSRKKDSTLAIVLALLAVAAIAVAGILFALLGQPQSPVTNSPQPTAPARRAAPPSEANRPSAQSPPRREPAPTAPVDTPAAAR
jgi:hypothetical protein